MGVGQNVQQTYDLLSQKDTEWLMEQGREYFLNQEGDKALPYFLIVSERYKSDKDEEAMRNSIRALNNIGCVFKYHFNDYLKAYDYFNKAYDLSEENNFKDFMPQILTNLSDLLNDYGIVYNSEEMKRKAEEIFNQSFSYGLEHKDWTLLATSFFNYANNNYELNLEKYKGLFSKEIPDDHPFILQVRMLYKGIESMQSKDYLQARNYFQQQLDSLQDGVLDDRLKIATQRSIAETYRREGDYEMCLSYLQKALEHAQTLNIIEQASTLSKQMSELYSEIGEKEKSSEYRYIYLDEMNSLHEKRLDNIGELDFFYALKKEEERARELQGKERFHLYLNIGVAFILIIVVIAVIIIWRKNRFLHARNKSLYHHYQLLLNAEKENKVSPEKGRTANLNEEQRATLLNKINDVIHNPDYICRQDFGLKELAKAVDSNTTYVSRVINETYNESLSNIISGNRIKEACRRINEREDYQRLTIEAIANDVGFKSRTAFLNAFKREVGLTPSEYIKMAKESNL